MAYVYRLAQNLHKYVDCYTVSANCRIRTNLQLLAMPSLGDEKRKHFTAIQSPGNDETKNTTILQFAQCLSMGQIHILTIFKSQLPY
jgi:hypothetical protein